MKLMLRMVLFHLLERIRFFEKLDGLWVWITGGKRKYPVIQIKSPYQRKLIIGKNILLKIYNKTIVVPVALQSRGQNIKEINIVKSAYGKGKKTTNTKWFEDQIKAYTRYINEHKLQNWQEDSGVQFSSGYANIFNNKIYTENDLVKFRNPNGFGLKNKKLKIMKE